MKPERLPKLMLRLGKLETYPAGQVFHAQDFPETLFMLKSGYVKRYQTKENERVIELIYGPGHIFPLTHLYKKLFKEDHNQENLVYVYQAMTDIEIWRIDGDTVVAELKKDTTLYIDLFHEAGLRLRSNIDRLASNALKNDYKKVAHQLVCLAEEFGEPSERNGTKSAEIPLPLTPKDMAEQLNISTEVAEAMMGQLEKQRLIKNTNNGIRIPDLGILKDAYM